MSVKRAVKRKFNKKSLSGSKRKFDPKGEDEILSDSDEDLKNESTKNDEDSDIDETAQEKKLRLTKQYLQELKDLQAEDAVDSVGEKLQEDILEQAGKLQKKIADKCSKPDSSSLQLLRGHKLPITCLVVSSDGKLLFTASKDCCIIKYDAITLKKLHKIFGGHNRDPKTHNTGHVLALAISTDNEFLVSSGTDKMIHVWKVDSCEHVHRFHGHRDIITGLAFRMNSHQLFSSSYDRCVKVWDLDSMGYVETLFGHQDQVQACDSLTRERCASAGGRDGSVRIWKIVEESQLVFHGHQGSIDCLKLINEEYYITGSDDGSICLWSVMKKKPIVTIKDAHPGQGLTSPWITSVTALVNSDLVATGSSNGTVKIWKCGHKFLSIECVFEIPVTGFVNSLQFSPTGDRLFIGIGQEHRLGRWWRIKEAKNSVIVAQLMASD